MNLTLVSSVPDWLNSQNPIRIKEGTADAEWQVTLPDDLPAGTRLPLLFRATGRLSNGIEIVSEATIELLCK